MDRINATNWIDIGGGRRGFRDRDTLAGIAGTRVAAVWMNGVQESVLALIEGVNLAPNASDGTQLWEALLRLTGAHITSVTATVALGAGSAGVVLVNATSGNLNITLPGVGEINGAVQGVAKLVPQVLTFVRTDTTANTVTLLRAGGDVLGAGSVTSYLLGINERLMIAGDGSGVWLLMACNLLGRRRAAYTATGSFTPPAWVERVRAIVVGGGGGGGGNTTNGAGGGGGGGGLGDGDYVITPGAAIAVTVGAAGAGGSNSSGSAAGNNGGTGGTSSLGSYVSATGGAGGGGSLAGGSGPSGGGGLGASGLLNLGGTDGGAGFAISGSGYAGYGGASAAGGGGGAPSTGLPSAGRAAGGGGAGGGSNFAGAAGAAGLVVVWY